MSHLGWQTFGHYRLAIIMSHFGIFRLTQTIMSHLGCQTLNHFRMTEIKPLLDDKQWVPIMYSNKDIVWDVIRQVSFQMTNMTVHF